MYNILVYVTTFLSISTLCTNRMKVVEMYKKKEKEKGKAHHCAGGKNTKVGGLLCSRSALGASALGTGL